MTITYRKNQKVRDKSSGEIGKITQINTNSNEPEYLVRYRDGKRRSVKEWWRESAIEAA